MFPEGFSNNPEKLERRTSSFGASHFSFVLFGLQMLMDKEFSCPCSPGFNAILISLIFLGPALMALAVMIFIQKPCRRSPFECARLFLLCLIPPSLWMFLLLFDGEYVACGMAHWEGDYVLDEELQIKWCKPKDAGVNATDLRELTEKIFFYSKFSALVLLTFLSVVVIAAVNCWDCRIRCLEHQEKRDKQIQLSESSVYGSEVELQRSV